MVNQEKEINADNPAFAVELVDGTTMKSGDTLESKFTISYSCPAAKYSPAGVYPIFLSAKENGTENYVATTVDGTLTITGPQYNIRFRGVSNGRVTALINMWKVLPEDFSNGYNIDEGSTVRFTAIPYTGYRVEKWAVNGVEILREGSAGYDTSAYITTSSLSKDVVVEVYFVPDMCSLTYSVDGSNGLLEARVGSVSVGPGAVLPSQTVVSFLAAPDAGYMVSQWTVNGAAVSGYTKNSYDLTVAGNTDVQVSFAPTEYLDISYAATGKGRVAAQYRDGPAVASGSQIIKGSSLVFTAAPDDANTMIKEWLVNGQVVQGNKSVYTSENIQQALQVEVVFINAISYRVNFSAIGYDAGALTAEVDGTPIASGDLVKGYADVVFTAHTPAGYRVKQWNMGSSVVQDTGGNHLQGTTYILEQLKSSVTVTVEFEKVSDGQVGKQYTVKFSAGSGGSINATAGGQEISSGASVAEGSRIVFTVQADSGIAVDHWSGVENGILSADKLTLTIDSLASDEDVYVTFKDSGRPGGGASTDTLVNPKNRSRSGKSINH